MEKIKKSGWSNSKKIEGANLYLSDIQHLIVEAEKRDLKVEIEDTEFKYSSVEELNKEKGDRIRRLDLIITEPKTYERLRIELSLGRWKIVPGQGDKLDALQLIIVDLLNSRKPWFTRYPGPFPTLLVAYFVMSSSMLFQSSNPKLAWSMMIFPMVALGIGVISWTASIFSGVIYLKRAHELQSWSEKHGEKLFYTVLGTILGGSAKWLLEKLLP